MPLRRLELKDFKSYRGVQVIDLGTSHFSCIIGPNGSGKSNLMDAISFVLGVRSQQLRSGQLKELIYRGRKAMEGESGVEGVVEAAGALKKKKAKAMKGKKKEVKAKLGKRKQRDDDDLADPEDEDEDEDEDDEDSDLTEEEEDEEGDEEESAAKGPGENDAKSAWVMAVYEDQKGKEFKYKRSITYSGSSLYTLNGKQVTASTYSQSLESHNILVKAKNFLVFQGDVEQVASQSAKDLCKLVDQISGSLDLAAEYNTAKANDEKAKELATQNWAKNRGIRAEVKQFKEQKDEVRRWKALKEEKDKMVVQHLLWRLYHIETSISASQEAIEAANEKLSGLKAEVTAEDKKVVAARKAQAEANLALKKEEADVKKALKALEEKKPNLLAIDTKIEHSKRKIATSQAILKTVKDDEDRHKATIATYKRDKEEAEKAAEQAAERQRKASEKKGVALNAADLATYHTLRAQANQRATEERKRLEALNRDAKKLNDQLRSLQDKVAQAEGKQTTLTNDESAAKQRVEMLKTKLSELSKDQEQVKGSLDAMLREKNRIQKREVEINQNMSMTLRGIMQARQDRNESSREVKFRETIKGLRNTFPGVRGRAVDLCKPAMEKYSLAIQTVLGRHLDSVIVDQEKIAIEAIQHLRQTRAGQATFLPLDTIQLKKFPEKYRNMGRTLRPAIDCITCGDLGSVFEYICGSTLICETEEEAKRVFYQNNQDVKIVTLDGTVFHKSGLITGGQGNGPQRKYNQKQEEDLQIKQANLQAEMAKLQTEKPSLRDEEALHARLRQLSASVITAKDDLAAATTSLEGLTAELDHVKKLIETTKAKIVEAEKSIADNEARAAALLETVKAADAEVFGDFCARIGVANIAEYENVQLKAAQLAAEARMHFDAQIKRLTQEIERCEGDLETARGRRKKLEAVIKTETDAVEKTLKAERKTLEEEISEAEQELEGLKDHLVTVREAADAKSSAVDIARKAANKASRNHDNVVREIGTENDSIEKNASDRWAIYRRCRLEEIELPLKKGHLSKVPLEENLMDDDDAMDIDGQQGPKEVKSYGIELEYKDLSEEDKDDAGEEYGATLEKKISDTTAEIDKMAPNLRSVQKLNDVEKTLRETDAEAEEAKKKQKQAHDDFAAVKKKRCQLFQKAFDHISGCIDKVYKELTKGPAAPAGGVAYLSLEDTEEPYLAGIKYHAMPPMKRFRDMEQLSGGEKTMAALALLFAIHSFQPSPFFVLDEVDAALDNTNVGRIASYIRKHCGPTFQFIVISLKGSLYERANSLVGIYRDQDVNSSQSLTLDLQKYDD